MGHEGHREAKRNKQKRRLQPRPHVLHKNSGAARLLSLQLLRYTGVRHIHLYLIRFGSRHRDAHWVFKSSSALVCLTGHRLSRASPDPPRPRDCATPAPHSSTTGTVGSTGKRRSTAAELGERGAWEGARPGTACSVLGKRRDPREYFRRQKFE